MGEALILLYTTVKHSQHCILALVLPGMMGSGGRSPLLLYRQDITMQETAPLPSCMLADAQQCRVTTLSLSSPNNNNSRVDAENVHSNLRLASGKATRKIAIHTHSPLVIYSSWTFACRRITNGTCICSLQGSSHGSHPSNLVICSTMLCSTL